jgi:hypothetical protein
MMIDLLIDSGAFSAFTCGKEIKLSKYIGFLQCHPNIVHRYISLDHIPGQAGRRTADPKATQKTYRNHQAMKDAGLEPWAVFHRQDDFRWLERYLLDGERHIALAPHPVHDKHEVVGWLRRCFDILPSSVKVHGLGITTAVMLEYFRFASVDSASWITVAKYGGILVPIFNCGQPDFSHRPRVISVTEPSSRRYNHFKWLDPFRREQTEHFLQVSGTSLPEIIESRAARLRVCIKFYQGLAECTGTKIYFVSSFERVVREALAHCDARSHLLSYADLKNKRPGAIENYCFERPYAIAEVKDAQRAAKARKARP